MCQTSSELNGIDSWACPRCGQETMAHLLNGKDTSKVTGYIFFKALEIFKPAKGK